MKPSSFSGFGVMSSFILELSKKHGPTWRNVDHASPGESMHSPNSTSANDCGLRKNRWLACYRERGARAKFLFLKDRRTRTFSSGSSRARILLLSFSISVLEYTTNRKARG